MTPMSAENRQRYNAAMHAMQTGVALDQELGSQDGTPKHLRVGVNSALMESSMLARMLIAKGVFTWEEYYDALVEAAELEALEYQQRIQDRYGSDKIILG